MSNLYISLNNSNKSKFIISVYNTIVSLNTQINHMSFYSDKSQYDINLSEIGYEIVNMQEESRKLRNSINDDSKNIDILIADTEKQVENSNTKYEDKVSELDTKNQILISDFITQTNKQYDDKFKMQKKINE